MYILEVFTRGVREAYGCSVSVRGPGGPSATLDIYFVQHRLCTGVSEDDSKTGNSTGD